MISSNYARGESLQARYSALRHLQGSRGNSQSICIASFKIRTYLVKSCGALARVTWRTPQRMMAREYCTFWKKCLAATRTYHCTSIMPLTSTLHYTRALRNLDWLGFRLLIPGSRTKIIQECFAQKDFINDVVPQKGARKIRSKRRGLPPPKHCWRRPWSQRCASCTMNHNTVVSVLIVVTR